MKNMFKNWNIGGLLVLLFAVVLTVSWKAVDSRKAEEKKWFQVSILDNNEPHDQLDNQSIVGEYPGGAPSPTGDCAEENPNTPLCAIELELPDTVSFPITMQDVVDNSYPQGEKRNREE